VLVDDASTDATPRRLAQFKAAHGEVPVTIVRNARNLGVSGARNSGIVAARGRYLFFTDSDCAVSPRWLAAMLAGFDDPTISAVAGAVIDPPPRNWAERAYFGTARIGQNRWQGRRLVGNNMGFRVEVLQAYMFDPAMNYYCDEDDIALRMREDGHRFAFAPEAVVRHDHPVTLKSYLKMALRQGVGSARLWYKHNRWLGRDLWPAAAALATLPWGLFDARLWTLPALCGLLQVAAILYNETQLKGKSRSRALQALPVCLLYYVCRIYAVARTLLTIALGGEQPVRRSKRLWRERRAPLAPPPKAKSPRRAAA
jgi:GT2 family glycosyltransferase